MRIRVRLFARLRELAGEGELERHVADGATALSGGFGLRGLRERAEQLGGTLEVESTPGEGTTVSVTIPAFRTETYPVPA